MAESASPYLHADSSESDEEITLPRESAIDAKTVSQHRKAFVSWVNDEFYPQVVQSAQDSPLKAYQVLIQAYLGLDTPYRGLLVYHGLGTGKTASAVSLASSGSCLFASARRVVDPSEAVSLTWASGFGFPIVWP